jgi:hypothetical protein
VDGGGSGQILARRLAQWALKSDEKSAQRARIFRPEPAKTACFKGIFGVPVYCLSNTSLF